MEYDNALGGDNQFFIDNFEVWSVTTGTPIGLSESSGTTNVTFDSSAPNFRLNAKDSSTSQASSQFVPVAFNSITEVDSESLTGKIVNVRGVPGAQFNVSRPSGNRIIFTQSLLSNVTLTFGFELFSNATSISFAGGLFSVLGHSLKWNMSISNWPFNSTANFLRTLIFLGSIDQPFTLVNISDTPSMRSFVLQSVTSTNDTILASLLLPLRAIADGVSVNISAPILVTSLAGGGYRQSTPGDTVYGLLIFFPYFQLNILYDPDFGALLQTSAGSSNGDGGNNNGLIIGLSVGLTLGALLVVILVMIAVVVIVIVGKYVRASQSGMVEFDAITPSS